MRISELARLVLLSGALTVVVAPIPAAQPEWVRARPDHAWSFPADHWAHRGYRVEWWYVTGHLRSVDDPEDRFGFQLTMFRIGLSPQPHGFDSAWDSSNLVMGHAAITDVRRRGHRFSELLYRETELLAGFGTYPDPQIAWSRGPAGSDGGWGVRWNGAGFDLSMSDDAQGIAFELTTRPLKPLVLQGAGGFSRKSDRDDAASQYYSFTRLETTGSLTLDGRQVRVRGESWMDQEFSTSQLGEDQVGWDWFSLQLDDGRELMLFSLRAEDGSVDHARGTLIGRKGEARYLDRADWSVSVAERWRSPATGAEYPSRWRIVVPTAMIDLEAVPLVRDQENVGRLAGGLHYWEGAVDLREGDGGSVGSGYVELTGYGEGNRPPI